MKGNQNVWKVFFVKYHQGACSAWPCQGGGEGVAIRSKKFKLELKS